MKRILGVHGDSPADGVSIIKMVLSIKRLAGNPDSTRALCQSVDFHPPDSASPLPPRLLVKHLREKTKGASLRDGC